MNADLSDLLEREPPYTERTQPRSRVADPEDDYQAFSHGRVGRRPAMMIAFRSASGRVSVFPYSHLCGIESMDPDSGFTLTFTAAVVKVAGINLKQLFRYVCEHRTMEINEADRADQMTDDMAAVSAISVSCSPGKDG